MVIGLILLAYPVYAHAMRACDNPCARPSRAPALLRTGLCADSPARASRPCRRLQSAHAGRFFHREHWPIGQSERSGWNQWTWSILEWLTPQQVQPGAYPLAQVDQAIEHD